MIKATENRKVLISSDNEKVYAKCSTLLSSYGYEVTLVPREGTQVVAAIKEQSYDVVLMEATMAQCDAVEVLKLVRKDPDIKLPLFMVVSFPNVVLERELCSYGCDYFFIRPVDVDTIVKRVISFTEAAINILKESTQQKNAQQANLREFVAEMLHDIGVPSHLKGYHYIRDAIIMVVESPNILSIMKELYPAVANKNSSTLSNVERSMRTAIMAAWNRGDKKMLRAHFAYAHSKPKNSEFIATIAGKVRMRHNT